MSITMKSLKVVLVATLTSAVMALHVSAKELTILVDVSKSNPMLMDKAFNQRAASQAVRAIQALQKGDVVSLHTFGSLQSADNIPQHLFKLKRHNQKKVAFAVGKYLTEMPEKIQAQGSTNLIAWFNRNPQNCRKEAHQVLAITDAIEASEYVDPNKLLAGKQSLPAPSDYTNVRGCDVQFFGIGAGRGDMETIRLRKAWEVYFEQAGARFTAVPL